MNLKYLMILVGALILIPFRGSSQVSQTDNYLSEITRRIESSDRKTISIIKNDDNLLEGTFIKINTQTIWVNSLKGNKETQIPLIEIKNILDERYAILFTSTQFENYRNADQGLKYYNGEWLSEIDIQKIEGGYIQYRGKWLSKADTLNRGFFFHESKWLTREDAENMGLFYNEGKLLSPDIAQSKGLILNNKRLTATQDNKTSDLILSKKKPLMFSINNLSMFSDYECYYFILKGIAVGGSISGDHFNSDNIISTNFSISPSVRYYLLNENEEISDFPELIKSFVFSNIRYEHISSGILPDGSHDIQLSIGAGIYKFFIKKVALEAMVGYRLELGRGYLGNSFDTGIAMSLYL